MKTLKLWLSVAFLFIIISPAYTQLQEGYIINNTGDTIKGLVFNASNFKNTNFIKFKDRGSSKLTVYTPLDIKGYGIGNDKVYISSKVEDSPLNSNVFLKQIVKGDVSLYQAANKSGTRSFLLGKNESIIYLKEKVYLGMLKLNLNECKTINYDSYTDIRKLNYTKQKLSNLVVEYNKCIAPDAPIEVRKEKIHIILTKGFIGGINNTAFNITYPNFYSGKYSEKGYEAGIFLNMDFSKNLYLQLEGIYSFRSGKGTRKTEYPLAEDYILDFDFSVQYLNFPVLFGYKIPGRFIRPYLNLGPNALIRIGSNGEVKDNKGMNRSYQPGNGHPYYELTYKPAEAFNFGLTAGIGMSIFPFLDKKEIKLEIRYNSNSLSQGASSIGNIKTTQLLLGFGF